MNQKSYTVHIEIIILYIPLQCSAVITFQTSFQYPVPDGPQQTSGALKKTELQWKTQWSASVAIKLPVMAIP